MPYPSTGTGAQVGWALLPSLLLPVLCWILLLQPKWIARPFDVLLRRLRSPPSTGGPPWGSGPPPPEEEDGASSVGCFLSAAAAQVLRLASYLHPPLLLIYLHPQEAARQKDLGLLSRAQVWRLGALSQRLLDGQVSGQQAAELAHAILSSPPAAAAAAADSPGQGSTVVTVTTPGEAADTAADERLPLLPPASRLLALQAALCQPSAILSLGAQLDTLDERECMPDNSGDGSWNHTRSRIHALLNVANVLWAIGLLGVSVSFLPALLAVAAPLIAACGAAILAIHHALLPAYPTMGYIALCALTAYGGTQCSPQTAPFVALAGAGPAVALLSYQVTCSLFTGALNPKTPKTLNPETLLAKAINYL